MASRRFADVLAAAVQRHTSPFDAPQPTRSFGARTMSLPSFCPPIAPGVGASVYRAACLDAASQTPRSPRPARAFTPAQRLALDAMCGLGAQLREDFLDDELRREYRRLAKALHPDRHPAAAPIEIESLGRSFARLAEAYQALLGAHHGLD